MKFVCDEGVPRALGRRLRELGFDVSPAPPQWRGLSNSRLIAAAEAAGFEALLSNDKNMIFQLNLALLTIAIVTLPTNNRPSLVPRAADIGDTLTLAQRGQCVAIEINGQRWLRRSDGAGAIFVEELASVVPFDA